MAQNLPISIHTYTVAGDIICSVLKSSTPHGVLRSNSFVDAKTKSTSNPSDHHLMEVQTDPITKGKGVPNSNVHLSYALLLYAYNVQVLLTSIRDGDI